MNILYKTSAILLFLGAIAGLAFSAYGLVFFWRSQAAMAGKLVASIELIDRTLATTTEGLLMVDETILQARDDLELVQVFTEDVSEAVGNTRPTLESMSDLFGSDLVDIVANTQASLAAAETSATLVDDTLRIISAIPFLGARYAPAQPLGDSIGEISESLAQLPESLGGIEQGLIVAAEDLASIEENIIGMAERIGVINSNLAEAEAIIIEYQATTAELQEDLAELKRDLPGWTRTFSFGVSFLLAWVSIASLGMFSVGTLLWRQRHHVPKPSLPVD